MIKMADCVVFLQRGLPTLLERSLRPIVQKQHPQRFSMRPNKNKQYLMKNKQSGEAARSIVLPRKPRLSEANENNVFFLLSVAVSILLD